MTRFSDLERDRAARPPAPAPKEVEEQRLEGPSLASAMGNQAVQRVRAEHPAAAALRAGAPMSVARAGLTSLAQRPSGATMDEEEEEGPEPGPEPEPTPPAGETPPVDSGAPAPEAAPEPAATGPGETPPTGEDEFDHP
jgi:hypothetical protein